MMDTDVYVTEYANVSILFPVLELLVLKELLQIVELTFTPLANIDVDVKVYLNALRCEDDDKDNT
jgi:hypothetical protein